jgi:uncharacterized protein YndB with AHSA1/START domain
MAEKTTVATNVDEQALLIERVYNAPRELVFKAWSEPERLAQWWGPKGWTLPVCNVDFRLGGVWHYCMQGPDGEQSWGKAVYSEIVPPERIAYTDGFSDEAGNLNPDMPAMVISIDFVAEGDKTRMVSRAQFASKEDMESLLQMGMIEGLTQTLDRLDEYLATA